MSLYATKQVCFCVKCVGGSVHLCVGAGGGCVQDGEYCNLILYIEKLIIMLLKSNDSLRFSSSL